MKARSPDNLYPILLLFCISLLSLSGCTGALPGERAPEDLRNAVERSEAAAADAHATVAKIEAELDRSKSLIREARSLVLSAEEAERKCAALVKRIPRYRRRPVCPKPRKKAKVKAPLAPGAKEPPSATPEDEPLYSPSDAPL